MTAFDRLAQAKLLRTKRVHAAVFLTPGQARRILALGSTTEQMEGAWCNAFRTFNKARRLEMAQTGTISWPEHLPWLHTWAEAMLDTPPVQLELGGAQLALRRLNAARQSFRLATQGIPYRAAAWAGLAQAEAELVHGRAAAIHLAAMQAEAARAVALEPRTGACHGLLADALVRSGDVLAARAWPRCRVRRRSADIGRPSAASRRVCAGAGGTWLGGWPGSLDDRGVERSGRRQRSPGALGRGPQC